MDTTYTTVGDESDADMAYYTAMEAFGQGVVSKCLYVADYAGGFSAAKDWPRLVLKLREALAYATDAQALQANWTRRS